MKEVKYVERNQEVSAAACSTQKNANWVRGIGKILHVHVIAYCKSLYISMHVKGEGLRFELDLLVYPHLQGLVTTTIRDRSNISPDYVYGKYMHCNECMHSMRTC